MSKYTQMNPNMLLTPEDIGECSEIEDRIEKFKKTGQAPPIITRIANEVLDNRERDIISLRCLKVTRKTISKKYGITEDYARTIEKNTWQKIRARAQLLKKLNT